jgi:hypothetical protein
VFESARLVSPVETVMLLVCIDNDLLYALKCQLLLSMPGPVHVDVHVAVIALTDVKPK